MSDPAAVVMPRLSETAREGTVVAWLVGAGGRVRRGQAIGEIEVEKAAEFVSAPVDGILEIVVAEGEAAAAGAVIARVRAPQVAPDEPASGGGSPAGARPGEAPGHGPHEPDIPSLPRVAASPLARRLAALHDVDLSQVRGSGPGGLILRGDVGQAAGLVSDPPASRPEPVARPATGASTIRPLGRIQRVVAERMAAAHAEIPAFSMRADVRMDAAVELRGALALQLDGGPRPSLNDLVVRALALALRREPLGNSSFRDGAIEMHERINIGIAVAVDDGLLVPVVTDADRRTVAETASATRALIEGARAGTLSAAQLAGATCTVTNLGMQGVDAFAATIDPPQAAILAVGAVRDLPVVDDGLIRAGRVMSVTLSADHRVMNGADGARLLSQVRAHLEHPLRLLA